LRRGDFGADKEFCLRSSNGVVGTVIWALAC